MLTSSRLRATLTVTTAALVVAPAVAAIQVARAEDPSPLRVTAAAEESPSSTVVDPPRYVAPQPGRQAGVVDRQAEIAEREAEAQARAEAEALEAYTDARDRAVAIAEFAGALAADAAEEEAAAAGPPLVVWEAPPPSATDDQFDRLADCESGRNPGAYNPSGPYYGAFQFSMGTWTSSPVNMTGDPRDYSYEVQKQAARRLQAERGWAPWPSCARRLGYM